MMLRQIAKKNALAEACLQARSQGRPVGFVPTMGALHLGHRKLIREAVAQLSKEHPSPCVVVSIFVNPRQFNDANDLKVYPRTLEADLEVCRAEGAEVVFTPDVHEMYGPSDSTYVEVSGSLTEVMEGAFRPGHFRGVATVVAKLFLTVGPCTAFFGNKDYQQLQVVRRMTQDLNMAVSLVGVPTVREDDGLAFSSRNRLLSDADRKRAGAIPAGLRLAQAAYAKGERDARAIEHIAREHLITRVDKIDYIEVRDADSLSAIERCDERAVLALAVHMGSVRLIDNLVLGEGTLLLA